jgi:hypothetical protein
LELKEKQVAGAAKACDVRSVINLIAEHQLARDRIVVIGMECTGMLQNGGLAPGCSVCPASAPSLCDRIRGRGGVGLLFGPADAGRADLTSRSGWEHSSAEERERPLFSR